MDEEREFTREEANSLLPEVIDHLSRLRDAYAHMAGHQALVRSVRKTNGGDQHAAEGMRAGREVAGQLNWLDEHSIVLRDIEQGLIDFPSKREGRPIFLCWKFGEESVDHWHDLDTGFGGRQPLD